ncbi:helix-turn-helix transcriptional regulator [Streptomyces sp. NPDC002018]|uniref:helix-turn-helix transcriptional regulator n=1 Tax=Streptomyces sp. NPDC002018 TaxID=3364629 RepID=UPI0036AA8B16
MTANRKNNALGDFLRARRVTTDPQPVVMTGGRRRTPGMRREEVAALAGVSKDYYTRLEQGRERHPSEQVLDALATVLGLDAEARAHLQGLARLRGDARFRQEWSEEVSPHLLRLMSRWTETPAMVLSRCLYVLAVNDLARTLFSPMEPGDSLLRFVFLSPASRGFYAEWERVARNGVGSLRAAAGVDPEDPRLVALVAELSAGSADFRRLWHSHDVRAKTWSDKSFHHPVAGDLTLTYETFTVNSAPGQQLLVYQAEPGSPSEHALRLLGTLAGRTPSRDGARTPSADAARTPSPDGARTPSATPSADGALTAAAPPGGGRAPGEG